MENYMRYKGGTVPNRKIWISREIVREDLKKKYPNTTDRLNYCIKEWERLNDKQTQNRH